MTSEPSPFTASGLETKIPSPGKWMARQYRHRVDFDLDGASMTTIPPTPRIMKVRVFDFESGTWSIGELEQIEAVQKDVSGAIPDRRKARSSGRQTEKGGNSRATGKRGPIRCVTAGETAYT